MSRGRLENRAETRTHDALDARSCDVARFSASHATVRVPHVYLDAVVDDGHLFDLSRPALKGAQNGFGSGSGGTTPSSGGSATNSGGTAGKASGTGGSSGGAGDSGAGGANGGSGGEPSSTEFPGALSVDVWVVGWAGDLDHYSWVRFTAAADGTSGT
jgi:hypothetical protein